MNFLKKLFTISSKKKLYSYYMDELSAHFKSVTIKGPIAPSYFASIMAVIVVTGESYKKWNLVIEADAAEQRSICELKNRTVTLCYNITQYSEKDVKFILLHELRHVQQFDLDMFGTSIYSTEYMQRVDVFKGVPMLPWVHYTNHSEKPTEIDANEYAIAYLGTSGYSNYIVKQIIEETLAISSTSTMAA